MRRVWSRVGAGLVLAGLLATAAAGGFAVTSKPKPPPNYGPIVKKIIATDSQPCGEIEGFGAMWITNFGSGTLQRIDPRTNRVTGRVQIGARPCGLATGAGAVWINGYGSDSVERVDPETMQLTAHIEVGDEPFDVLFADGDVWTTNRVDENVMRIDPETNGIVATIPIGEEAAGLGFADGSVWVGALTGKSILRIDPATNAVTPVSIGHERPTWLSTRDREIWVSSITDGVVVRVDPQTNAAAETVRVRSSPVDGAVDARGLVWIPNRGDNSVSIVDAASATLVSTIRVGTAPFVLNDGFGDIWSASYGGRDVRRLRPPRISEAALTGVKGSGQSGTVRLIAVARKSTRVVVTLEGAPGREVVHVHGGRCGAFKASSIKPWTLRNGRGSRLVRVPIRKLAGGRYALDVHRAQGEKAYVACANLG